MVRCTPGVQPEDQLCAQPQRRRPQHADDGAALSPDLGRLQDQERAVGRECVPPAPSALPVVPKCGHACSATGDSTHSHVCGVTVTRQPRFADADGSAQHWHITSGKCLHTINDPDNQLFCVDYRPDGALFATAGKDRSVRVYDEATKSLVTRMSGGYVPVCTPWFTCQGVEGPPCLPLPHPTSTAICCCGAVVSTPGPAQHPQRNGRPQQPRLLAEVLPRRREPAGQRWLGQHGASVGHPSRPQRAQHLWPPRRGRLRRCDRPDRAHGLVAPREVPAGAPRTGFAVGVVVCVPRRSARDRAISLPCDRRGTWAPAS